MKNIYDIKIDFECPSKIIASPLLVGFFLPQLLSHEWRNLTDHTSPQYGYNIPMLKLKI